MTSKPTQTERILALLRARGASGLTPKEALAEVGTMRLAARIADLRAAGHLIITETYTTPNGARVARYVLKGERITWDQMRAVLEQGVREGAIKPEVLDAIRPLPEDEWTEAEKREAWGR